MARQTSTPESPLRPVEFYILLGLAAEDLHGYGIIQRTEQQSQGRIRGPYNARHGMTLHAC